MFIINDKKINFFKFKKLKILYLKIYIIKKIKIKIKIQPCGKMYIQ